MCTTALYEIEDRPNHFNYYHYQPGSNIIILNCKHITHTHMLARTHAHTHTVQVVAVRWVGGAQP